MDTFDENLRRVAAYGKLPAETILLRSNDPKVGRARLHMAYLLASSLWTETGAGRILSRLNCTIGVVQLAKRLFLTDETFRKEISEIKGSQCVAPKPDEPGEADADATNKSDFDEKADADPKRLLLRIWQEFYGFTQEEMLKKHLGLKAANARKVLIFLAKHRFGMKNVAIADILRYAPETVRNTWKEAQADSSYDPFKKELERVAKHFCISLNKKPVKQPV